MEALKNYPGAKSGSGIAQWLINQIPVHDRYFELFAGSAQLYRAKKPARFSMLADIDKRVFEALQYLEQYPGCIVNNSSWNDCFLDNTMCPQKGDFVYLDPPYPISSLRTGKKHYRYIMTDAEHVQLLSAIRTSNANIMISTKHNSLYEDLLSDWRKSVKRTADHVGAYEEVIYMNYDLPVLLHQYDYVGLDFTDRQRIKRKIDRFSTKLSMLPEYEKHLFIQELIKNDTEAVKHFLTMVPGS